MTTPEFDDALIAAAFRLGASTGWRSMSVAAAARAASVPLDQARTRFPSLRFLLRRFGARLDEAALATAPAEGTVRDRLFDLLMSRLDAMKPHRDGIRALARYAPLDPALALELACGTRRSMTWMLEAAGESSTGLRGELRVHGLIAVWLWSVRAFERDETEDLAPTMVALDAALDWADSMAGRLVSDQSLTAFKE